VSKYLRNKRWTLRVPHPYGGSVEKGIGTGNTKTAEHYPTSEELARWSDLAERHHRATGAR
jgi:hypothetical protein